MAHGWDPQKMTQFRVSQMTPKSNWLQFLGICFTICKMVYLHDYFMGLVINIKSQKQYVRSAPEKYKAAQEYEMISSWEMF